MKIMKRVISLVMAVIMLITGTPALQASELALDRAQMAELQKEILQDVKADVNIVPEYTKLMNHYQQAKKNVEERLNKLNDIELTEEQQKAVEEYVNQLKEKAEELAKTEEYEIVPKEERRIVAFNTLLFADFEEISEDIADFWDQGISNKLVLIGGGTLVLSLLAIPIAIKFEIGWLIGASTVALKLGTGLILGALMIVLFTNSYIPVINFSLDAEETNKVFSEKPFEYLSKIENEAEYANLNKKCPQLLKDAVDIEYDTSLNVTSQNIKEKLYIGSLDWYKMSTEERADYLHNFAERLRAESKAGAKEQFNNLRIGLEER